MEPTSPPVADDPTDVSLPAMRTHGLVYHKTKTSGHIPGIPAQTMTGPEAAAAIPDRATLDAVLATGWYTLGGDPPAKKKAGAVPAVPPPPVQHGTPVSPPEKETP